MKIEKNKKIKKISEFYEAISGTELVGNVGPAYGDTRSKNKNLNKKNVRIIYNALDDKLYTYDDFYELYIEYLKLGGKPLHDFNVDNINKIIFFIKKKNK